MLRLLGEDVQAEENIDTNAVSKPEPKKGLFRRLAKGLTKTRKNLNNGFDRLVGSHAKLDDNFMDELEEVLLSADIGIDITGRIVDDLRDNVKKNLLRDTSQVIEFVKKDLTEILTRSMPEEQTEPSR